MVPKDCKHPSTTDRIGHQHIFLCCTISLEALHIKAPLLMPHFWRSPKTWLPIPEGSDEYAYHIPHPVRKPKYTKVKVPVPKINTASAASAASASASAEQFAELCHCCCLIKDLATTSLPEYIATHSHQTDYLAPLRTRQELNHYQSSQTWKS